MLSIVTFLWDRDPKLKKQSAYEAHHVNVLRRMLERHLDMDHELVCITNMPDGIDSRIRILPLWRDYSTTPGCYRRLKLFDPKVQEHIGERFALIDLDVIILANVTDIFARLEPFIAWGEHYRITPICGSFWIMDAGAYPEVWTTFDPDLSPVLARKKGYKTGTDQAWLSYCLYGYVPMMGRKDGIYNYALDIKPIPRYRIRMCDTSGRTRQRMDRLKRYAPMAHSAIRGANVPQGELPEDARMVFFNGKYDQTSPDLQAQYPWIAEHWR